MTIDTPSSNNSNAKTGRGRPRDTDVDENILSAARELLARGGFDAMSFEAVAQIAGVTRPTIYRRWPTRVHLANEIANGGGRSVADVIEESGLRAQLSAFVTLLLDQYQRPETNAANAGLIMAFHGSPELRAELHDPLEKRAREHLSAIIRKAMSLNLVKSSVNVDALFDIAVGAVIFRTIFSSLPVNDNLAEEICDIIIAGIRSTHEGDGDKRPK